MKKLFNINLIVLVLTTNVIQVYGQWNNNFPCTNGVNTNPNNPTNNGLPTLPNGSSDTRFLNKFDWVHGNDTWVDPVDGSVNYTYQTHGMFFNENQPYGNMTNVKPLLYPGVGAEYYHYLFFSSQFSWENGWELLLMNLGYYPNTNTDGSLITHGFQDRKFLPYIVLYNRYTGIIRVFVAYGKNEPPNNAIDGVEITLSFVLDEQSTQEENVSGLLRLSKEGKDVTLDKPTASKSISAVAKHPGAENRWYSADFQIAYDPCTCVYPSRLALSFSFFSEQQLRLNGNYLYNNNISMTQAQNLINRDFLGNFEVAQNGAVSEGYIMYKDISKLLETYEKRMKKYEDDLFMYNTQSEVFKWNKIMAKFVKDALGAQLLDGLSPDFKGVLKIPLSLFSQSQWAQELLNQNKYIEGDKLNWTKLTKELEKSFFSEFGIAILGAFSKPQKPVKPTPPMLGYGQMSFAGSITNRFPVGATDFPSPGSFDYSTPVTSNQHPNFPLTYKYPIYNEVLGVFSLLENPKFGIINQPSNYDCNITGTNGQTGLFNGWISEDRTMQLQINEPLKYRFNPSLNYKNIDIQASIGFEGILPHPIPGELGEMGYKNIHQVNLESSNYIVVDQSTGAININSGQGTNPPNYISMYTPFVHIDALSDVIGSFKQTVHKQIISTPSQSYGHTISAVCSSFNGFSAIQNLKYKLKLIVNVEFDELNSEGETNSYTYGLTFDVDESNSMPNYLLNIPPFSHNAIFDNFPNSDFNFFQYPVDLYFSNTTFDGSDIVGCSLVGNSYTCKSVNNIVISGTIEILNNYSVTFEAGNEIVVNPESQINHEAILRIVPVLPNSTPMPEQTSGQVSAFCGNNNLYAANSLRSGLSLDNINQIYDTIQNQSLNEANNPIEFFVFPNPTTGASQAGLVLPELSTVSISIVDITGKVQGRPVRNQVLPMGRNVVNLESEPLAPGVYFVQLVVNGEKLTQRLVKQ